MPESNNPIHFSMADVRHKRITARRAVAVGEFMPGSAFADIVEQRLPKGDALVLAEVAGIQGAKAASTLMPLCHPLPIEYIRTRCVQLPDRQVIRVYCEVGTIARTGVEMEALAGVSAALLTLYDLTKPVQPALSYGNVRLLFKEGGKKGLWLHPDGMDDAEREHYKPRSPAGLAHKQARVVTLSDRAYRGEYQDTAGPLLAKRLVSLGAVVAPVEVLADDPGALEEHLTALAQQGIDLVFCTGGTGPGPRDYTPEVLMGLADKQVEGIGEMFRSESSQYTPLAWLSRATAVVIGSMLVIALPGSEKACKQGMDILEPILAHTLDMINGAGHS